ncbi:MAG TPA: hypothetical protein VKX28_15465 [Xanthobacteraceae bacterium]|nr:hypothetical protein [Xanthobacteraceae bacterium]
MTRVSIKGSLSTVAAAGALALAAFATSTPTAAQPHGYWHGYGGAYQAHYHWRSFRGSTCDFKTYSRDRQMNGLC